MSNYLENYNEVLKNKNFDCPLCERALDIRIDKNNKPYVVCDDCCAQLFIRGDEGIVKLCKIVDMPW